MKILIAGSRDIQPSTWRVQTTFEELIQMLGIPFPEEVEVVTGGARGADSSGNRWAVAYSHTPTVMKAEWDKYGKRAGYIRNKAMAETGLDAAIIFWDGESRGTKMMVDLLVERDIPHLIISG
jgi:hypothetical protein